MNSQIPDNVGVALGGRGRRRWLVVAGLAVLGLVCLLVLAYNVVTSAWFLKRVVLPRAGRALGAELTVSNAVIHPLSELELIGLRVTPLGQPALAIVGRIHVRYRLGALLKGRVAVDDCQVERAEFVLVSNPDGTSNLDPILRALAPQAAAPTAEKRAPSVLVWDVGRVAVKDVNVMVKSAQPGGRLLSMSLTGLNILVTNLKNDLTGGMSLSAGLALERTAPGTTPDRATAGLEGGLQVRLGSDGLPSMVDGQILCRIGAATGAFAELQGLGLAVAAGIEPNRIRELGCRIDRAGTELGRVLVSGPFDIRGGTGRLEVVVAGLGQQALNMVGLPLGVTFGQTTINSTNLVSIAEAGRELVVTGALDATGFCFRTERLSMPAVDLVAGYAARFTRAGMLQLDRLELTGARAGHEFLRGRLTQPLLIGSGVTNVAHPESQFRLVLSEPDLRLWSGMLPVSVTGGSLGAQLQVTCRGAGAHLAVMLSGVVSNLGLAMAQRAVSGVAVEVTLGATVTGFSNVSVETITARVLRSGQQLAGLAGTASAEIGAGRFEGRLRSELDLPGLSALVSDARLSCSSGRLVADLEGAGTFTNFQGALRTKVSSLGCRVPGMGDLTGLDADVLVGVARAGAKITLKEANIELQQAGRAAGRLGVSGWYVTTSGEGQVNAELVALNERLLGPLLNGLSGIPRLVGANVSGQVELRRAQAGALGGAVRIAAGGLAFSDGQGQYGPFAVALELAGTGRTNVYELSQGRLAFAKEGSVTNTINIVGRVGVSDRGMISGSVNVTAGTLDLTPFRDMLFGRGGGAQPAARKPEARRAEPQPQVEPAALSLPVSEFVLAVSVDRLLLGELDARMLRLDAKLRGSALEIKPVELQLNGGPISCNATVDLGVPGYRYDLVLDVVRVPLQPLVNTFSTEYKDKAVGELLLRAEVSGAGVTGAGLQRNLSGMCRLALTNAAVQLVGRRAQLLITPVALVLGLEDLLRASLTDLKLSATAGGGNVQLAEFVVGSDMFTARTTGELELAADLGASRFGDWPINFGLPRPLALKARLTTDSGSGAGTGADAIVWLPVFAKLGGTLAEPQVKVDKLVIAGLVAKSAAGLPNVAGKKASEVLGSVGELLTGSGAATNQLSGTNQPSGAIPGLPFNPLDVLRRR